MKNQILDYFIHAFTHLRRDMKNGGAPHKPILLLSIIHEYELRRISDNKIFITPELTHSFSVTWNKLVVTSHNQNFALPFFHLTGEKGNWWNLIPNIGCELWIDNASSMRSFGNLSVAVAFAEIDENLSLFLLNKESREILKEAILDKYFPETQSLVQETENDDYFDNLKNELYESTAEYRRNLEVLKKSLSPEVYQVEVFNRGSFFRREIITIYDETCCMSDLRVSAPYTISMVDACHIEQFSKTLNNHPTNGIALCPNLHRAFDRGIISIDDNYEVLLSDKFIEKAESDYSLRKLRGKTINLPKNPQLYPSLESLKWHRENVFRS